MPIQRSKDQEEEIKLQEKASRLLSSIEDPLERLRFLCLARSGSPGILSFGKIFRRMDDNSSGSLSRQEFEKGLRDSGFFAPTADDQQLNNEQVKQLFNIIDSNANNSIDYEEFLIKLRPPMNDLRVKLVEAAFKKLDVTGDGTVTLEDLRKVYSVKDNPDFSSGRRNEEEILKAFLAKFEKNTSTDGILTKQEFLDYYSGVSASIDDDLYFDLMMRRAWRL